MMIDDNNDNNKTNSNSIRRLRAARRSWRGEHCLPLLALCRGRGPGFAGDRLWHKPHFHVQLADTDCELLLAQE